MVKNIQDLICSKQRVRVIALTLSLISNATLTGQVNLIPNPSFENNIGIPETFNELFKCQEWYNGFGTVDYYSTFSPSASSCSMNIPSNWTGNQFTRTGNYYAGICLRSLTAESGYPPFSNYFEIISAKLNSQLKKDHIYDFTLFYSISDGSGYVSNQLSAYFSQSQFSVNTTLFNPLSQQWYDTTINKIIPQINYDTSFFLNDDTLNWQELRGCFLADGTENYVNIGNFRDGKFNKFFQRTTNFNYPCAGSTNSNYCYAYIDDVSLYDLGYFSGPARCRGDTIICFNSSLSIGNNIRDSSVVAWQPATALSCTDCPNPVASPTITTTYYVTKTLCSFVSRDSITITVYTPTLTATAGNFKSICSNDTVTLGRNDTTAFTNYQWLPVTGLSCTNCPQPVAMPFSTTTFTLNKNECALNTSDTVTIYVDDCEVKIPNIFTPNNDNSNDEWKIKLPLGFKFTAAAVYDRWGTLVYEIEEEVLRSPLSRFRSVSWDGRTTAGLECSAGVYYYVLIYEDKKGEVRKANGTMILVR